MIRMPKRLPSIQITGLPMDEVVTPCRIIPLARQPLTLFDSLETSFFEQGDAISTGDGQEVIAIERAATPLAHGKATRLGIAGAVAVTALCATWLIARRAHSFSATVATVTETAAMQEMRPPSPPSPSVPLIPQAAVAAPEPVTPPQEAPAVERSIPSPPQSTAGANPSVAAAEPAGGSLAECKKAARQRQSKDLLAVCAQAFAEAPSSAELATILAKAEFDRGHARQALD